MLHENSNVLYSQASRFKLEEIIVNVGSINIIIIIIIMKKILCEFMVLIVLLHLATFKLFPL